MQPAVLAVDLDETLLDVNSFPVFVRFLLAELLRGGQAPAALRLGAALAVRKTVGAPHERLKALVCRLAERVALEPLEAWAEELLEQHGTASVVELVAGWDGTTVLTTAAPERYARVVGLAAGFDVVHGSTVDARGRLRHNVREAKLHRLEAEGLMPLAAAVSDDGDLDAPLLAAAAESWLVTGGKLRRFSASDALPPAAGAGRAARTSRVHLVASLGGHLELLTELEPALGDRPRTWVTSEGARAQSLRARGERVLTLPRLDRSKLTPRALTAGLWLAAKERPAVVVTSGAGLVVPFTLVARALGAKVIFTETMARVATGSTSGRILARFADAFFVQWPELADRYAEARVCRPLLLEGVPTGAVAEGVGTFVTVGSHDQPFDRLLALVEQAVSAGVLPEPVFVQSGVSDSLPASLPGEAFISPEDFSRRVREAEVLVSHGGAGAIATMLRAGKRPIVVARRGDLAEHVDGHQAELIDKLDSLQLVVQVRQTITAADVGRTTQPLVVPGDGRPSLVDALAASIA